MLTTRLTVIASMIFMAAASRLVPHPPNLTAISAMALFGGAYLSDWRLAFAVPLAALLLSDALLGFYGHMEIVYGSFAAITAMGLLLRHRRTAPRIAGATLASSVFFFLVTNLAVWAHSHVYPHTATGLLACYAVALPFFRNMLAGDILYTAALFGGFAALEKLVPALRESPAAT